MNPNEANPHANDGRERHGMAGMSANSLTARQAKALSALLSSPSLADAAKTSGLGERTLYRYLKDPDFVEAYRKARFEQVRQAVAQVQRVAEKAAATLSAVMDDSLAKPSARVMAARTVMDVALRAVEIEDLEQRIARIEANEDGGQQDDQKTIHIFVARRSDAP